ncbi:MAG TPA: DUF1269 domain-containing protein [Actinomycetota bacterium]|nr:DUF1269 domain-containing protein [Actinomycetota bacterium]
MTTDSPFSPAYEVGVIVFADTDTADRVVDGLRQVGATHLVNDISILEHHENGRFSVHDYAEGATKATKVGAGAIIGSVAGAIVLGPFGLLAGLIGGGAVGATLGGRNPHDLGLSEPFVEELRASLPPGSSAVLIVGEPDKVDELIGHVKSTDVVAAKELRNPLTEAQAAAIHEAVQKQQGAQQD